MVVKQKQRPFTSFMQHANPSDALPLIHLPERWGEKKTGKQNRTTAANSPPLKSPPGGFLWAARKHPLRMFTSAIPFLQDTPQARKDGSKFPFSQANNSACFQ